MAVTPIVTEDTGTDGGQVTCPRAAVDPGIAADGVATGHSGASRQVRGLASLSDAQTPGLTLPQVDRLPEPPNSSFPKPDIPEPPAA